MGCWITIEHFHLFQLGDQVGTFPTQKSLWFLAYKDLYGLYIERICPKTMINSGIRTFPKHSITWNIIMEVWKIIFLSKWVICRFHVNLPGCIRMKNDILFGDKKPQPHRIYVWYYYINRHLGNTIKNESTIHVGKYASPNTWILCRNY